MLTIQEAINAQQKRVEEVKAWLEHYKDDPVAVEVWKGRLDEAEQALVGLRLIHTYH